MLVVKETSQDVFEELTPGTLELGNVRYPWQITELWSEAQLAEKDIYLVEVPDVPDGKTEISHTIERIEDVVTYVPEYEDIPEPEAPLPGTIPPILVAAVLNATIDNNDVANVSGMFNVAAVMYIGVGTYYVFFMSSQPDTEYDVVINGGAPVMSISERGTDYFCISACDAIGGNAVDPPNFGVQVYRV